MNTAVAETAERYEMPGRSWRVLLREKRKQATFRITIVVRGKRIIKTYQTEAEYLKWKQTYEQCAALDNSGIELVKPEVIYP
jgi:hypothetical protein